MTHRNCFWKRTPTQNGGRPYLQFINQMQIHLQNSSTYSPPKGGLCFELINQRGAESGFHQLDGGLLLFFFILPNIIKIKPDFILVSFSNVFISKKVYFLKICLNLVAQTKSVKNILLPVHCSGFFVTQFKKHLGDKAFLLSK